MADIQITAEYSDLHTLKRLLDSEIPKSARNSAAVFDREFNKVERSFNESAKASQNYYNSLLGVDKASSSAQKSARAFSTIFKSMDEDLKMAALAAEDYNRKLLGINNSSKSARDSASVFRTSLEAEERATKQATLALKQKEDTVESLKLKYNPLYAAMTLYERQLDEINFALKEGAISSSQYESQLELLNNEFNQFKAGTANFGNRFVQSNLSAQRSMNGLGVAVQQTGYQVGDFLVQVQSGTNWMVAFGQQATQLVGILPMLSSTLKISTGTLIGLSTGLGIAIPLITAVGAAWMRTREENEKTSKSIRTLEDDIKSLDNTLREWILTKEASGKGLSLEELLGTKSLEKAQKDLKEARDNLQELRNSLDELVRYGPDGDKQVRFGLGAIEAFNLRKQIVEAVQAEQEAEERLAKIKLKNSEEVAESLTQRFQTLQEEIHLQETLARYGSDSINLLREKHSLELDNLRATLEQEAATAGVLQEMQGVIDAVVDAKEEALQFERGLKVLQDGAGSLKSLIDTINFDNAIASSNAFLAKLGSAYNRALGIAKALSDMQRVQQDGLTLPGVPSSGGTGNVLWSNIPLSNQDEVFIPEGWSNPEEEGGGGRKGRKGGGGADRVAREREKQLETLIKSLQTERETVEAWHTEQQELLAQFSDEELQAIGGANEAKLRLEEEYQERLKALRQGYHGTALDQAETFMGEMASALANGNEKMVQVSKVFASVEALINAYRAYNQVLADPSLPWFAKIPAAVSVLAAGMKTVQSIKSVGSGGGGGGSGGGGSIATPAAQEASRPQEVIIRGLKPGMRLSPEELQEVFDQIYEENGRRGTVFSVALE